jgi:putative ABC transport system permease protein
VADQLVRDPDLVAVATSHNGPVDIEGRRVMAYGIDQHKGTIRSTIRTGALPSHDDEIALGPKLLADFHKRVGDTVTLNAGPTPHRLKIVGTALAPTSQSNAFNEEALLTPHAVDTYADFPAVEALLRVRPGADSDAVLAKLDARYPYGISDESLPHPPGPVRNLDQIRRLPLVLALFFALLGAVSVAQAILMTASERRRDISVLRVIGYTRRQTGSVLRGVAGAIAAVGIVIGVPAGFVAAQIGWHAVARSLSVDGSAAVPGAVIAVVTIAVVGFAMIVAMVPAHLAARRPPAAELQSE